MQFRPSTGWALLADPFRLEPPDAPNAVLVCATVRPGQIDESWSHFDDADVAGCDLDPQIALSRCRCEAAEYLSQLQPVDWTGEEIPVFDLVDGTPSRLPTRQVLRVDSSSSDVGTGCAAGRSFDEAVASAFWELVERDAAATWWYACGPARPLAPEIDTAAMDYLAQLRGGVRTRRTRLLDISPQPGLPVIVALSGQTTGGGFVAGMGADADPLDAARKATRELVQMEVGLRLAELKRDRGQPLNAHEARMLRREQALDIDAAALCTSYPPLAHPVPAGDPAARTRSAAQRLAQPMNVADLTRAQLGVPVAKLISLTLHTIPEPATWEAAHPDRVALY